jgi:ribose/xylose/arabinose/galactoside ABC-type transport system permease subunit
MRRWLGRLGPLIGVLLVALLFTALAPRAFLSASNLRVVAMHTVPVAVGALGMTFVVIAGGIDLSIGAVVALTMVAAAGLVRAGCDPAVASLLAALLGGLCGFANGLLVTRLRVVPFIVTLGTMGIARGTAKWLADNGKIDADPGALAALVRILPEPAWLLVGPAVWLLLLLAALWALLLHRTLFGLHVFALGSNEQNARLCGVPVERTKIAVYALCGLSAGLVGLLQFGQLRCGVPTTGVGFELETIAAVVIGGASLAGGEGSLFGTLLGALLMAVLENGCTLTGVPDHVQDVIVGAIIVGAVAVEKLRAR